MKIKKIVKYNGVDIDYINNYRFEYYAISSNSYLMNSNRYIINYVDNYKREISYTII